jgi:hypothetical protein
MPLLAFVGAVYVLTTGQIFELAVERSLVLDLPVLLVLALRVCRHRAPRLVLAVPFLPLVVAGATLLIGPAHIRVGFQFPSPAVGALALRLSLVPAVVIGIGGLPMAFLFGGGRTRRVWVLLASIILAALSGRFLPARIERVLYTPWSFSPQLIGMRTTRVRPASNSALDRADRPVTPVAGAQRARQSVPPVSASVRRP